MSQGKKPTVLLIEADTFLRRLIALGLQHQNMYVIEADSLASARSIETADLLIIDIDSGIHRDWSLLHSIQTTPTFATLPTIVLAWEQLPMQQTSSVATQMQIVHLTKPFDARVMQETIPRLLDIRASQEAAVLAQAEAVHLATNKTHTPTSISPIITAIGLLIAFVGMLLQITVTILGILIIVVALLWWTLGTKPIHRTVALG